MRTSDDGYSMPMRQPDPVRGGDAYEVPSINSATLLRGHPELRIEHGDGTIYRLRVTGRGKLILTK
jgi:hemin uptake protein HemP